jgi:hypothetical protein
VKTCISTSYGSTMARVRLGQGIPSMGDRPVLKQQAMPVPAVNPSIGELKRQLRHVAAANLTKLAVFAVPSPYSSVEWLDVIYDWIAARYERTPPLHLLVETKACIFLELNEGIRYFLHWYACVLFLLVLGYSCAHQCVCERCASVSVSTTRGTRLSHKDTYILSARCL